MDIKNSSKGRGPLTYHIEIINWEKHNPKLKKWHKYFLFHSGFFGSEKVSKLKTNEIALLIHLMCVACESQSQTIHISATTLPKQLRIGATKLSYYINRFEEFQLVRVINSQKTSFNKDKDKDKDFLKSNN